ncbi:hypothetical protein GGF31_003472 [Allomyces arbusculus]|nr:hypothetical protein GGF31_003472 [Allomyces arbusculus]
MTDPHRRGTAPSPPTAPATPAPATPSPPAAAATPAAGTPSASDLTTTMHGIAFIQAVTAALALHVTELVAAGQIVQRVFQTMYDMITDASKIVDIVVKYRATNAPVVQRGPKTGLVMKNKAIGSAVVNFCSDSGAGGKEAAMWVAGGENYRKACAAVSSLMRLTHDEPDRFPIRTSAKLKGNPVFVDSPFNPLAHQRRCLISYGAVESFFRDNPTLDTSGAFSATTEAAEATGDDDGRDDRGDDGDELSDPESPQSPAFIPPPSASSSSSSTMRKVPLVEIEHPFSMAAMIQAHPPAPSPAPAAMTPAAAVSAPAPPAPPAADTRVSKRRAASDTRPSKRHAGAEVAEMQRAASVAPLPSGAPALPALAHEARTEARNTAGVQDVDEHPELYMYLMQSLVITGSLPPEQRDIALRAANDAFHYRVPFSAFSAALLPILRLLFPN